MADINLDRPHPLPPLLSAPSSFPFPFTLPMPTIPTAPTVLLLPGWLNSGPGHWQTRWETVYGAVRVEQHDWLCPRRGDWSARLDDVVQDLPGPVLLAAHSLGCHLVAAWAAHSAQTARVLGALLVAPPDLDRDDTPPQLLPWRPVIRRRLPFAAHVVFSSNDPFSALAPALELARDWGATTSAMGAAGHVNAESGLGDWPQGWAWLQALGLSVP